MCYLEPNNCVYFLCYVDRASRYNRLKKNQLDACVRFAGCCSILEYRLLVSNVRLARSSHVQFATCDSVRMKLSLQYRDSVVFVVCQSTDMGRAVL